MNIFRILLFFNFLVLVIVYFWDINNLLIYFSLLFIFDVIILFSYLFWKVVINKWEDLDRKDEKKDMLFLKARFYYVSYNFRNNQNYVINQNEKNRLMLIYGIYFDKLKNFLQYLVFVKVKDIKVYDLNRYRVLLLDNLLRVRLINYFLKIFGFILLFFIEQIVVLWIIFCCIGSGLIIWIILFISYVVLFYNYFFLKR